jgi:hypothetical protein
MSKRHLLASFAAVAGCVGPTDTADHLGAVTGGTNVHYASATGTGSGLTPSDPSSVAAAQLWASQIDKTQTGTVAIELLPGTYTTMLQLSAADTGSSTMPVTWEAYNGGAVVFDGGVHVTGWHKKSTPAGTKWVATLPAGTQPFEDLYVNNARRFRPRIGSGLDTLGAYYHIVDHVDAPGTNCEPTTSGHYDCLDRFVYDPTEIDPSQWGDVQVCDGSGAQTTHVELVDFEQYAAAWMIVSCYDPTANILYMTGGTNYESAHPTSNGFLKNHRYLVENAPNAFSIPGQWYYAPDTQTLSYFALPGDEQQAIDAVIPQATQLLLAEHVSYVTFRGLTFQHGNYLLDPAGYGGLRPPPGAVQLRNVTHITWSNNIVEQTTAGGLQLVAMGNSPVAITYNQIDHSYFYDLGADAVLFSNAGSAVNGFNSVTETLIDGYGRNFPAATGITQENGYQNTYSHDEVLDGYHGAVHVHVCFTDCGDNNTYGAANNNSIDHVRAHDLFQGIMNDAGSLYFGPGNQTVDPSAGLGNVMHHNRVYDVTDSSIQDTTKWNAHGYGGDGLYIDDDVGRAHLYDNLVYRVSGNAVSFSGARDGNNQQSFVDNNIFAYARRSMLNAYTPYRPAIYPNPPAIPVPLFFIAKHNVFYFDLPSTPPPPNDPNPADRPFDVQGGCAYEGDPVSPIFVPYTAFEQWDDNLYYRRDGGFATDPYAFHRQETPASHPDGNPCGKIDSWTYFDPTGWQQQAEDGHSLFTIDPMFVDPTYPGDHYGFQNGIPLPGFNIWDTNAAGLTVPVTPPTFRASFPTAMYDPASGF